MTILSTKTIRKKIDNLTSYAVLQIVESRDSSFVPYASEDFEGDQLNTQIKLALNAVLVYHGYANLMLLSGIAAAALFAVKGAIESNIDSHSAHKSFKNSKSLAIASSTMFLHIHFDLLNCVSRILATALAAVSSGMRTARSVISSGVNDAVTAITSKLNQKPHGFFDRFLPEDKVQACTPMNTTFTEQRKL